LNKLKGKQKFPFEVIKQYKKKVQLLLSINKLEELKAFRGLNFEYLKGGRKGQCSLRLNNQYRLIINPVNEKQVQVLFVKELSKHYE
jgi:proteic killer suppression protein